MHFFRATASDTKRKTNQGEERRNISAKQSQRRRGRRRRRKPYPRQARCGKVRSPRLAGRQAAYRTALTITSPSFSLTLIIHSHLTTPLRRLSGTSHCSACVCVRWCVCDDIHITLRAYTFRYIILRHRLLLRYRRQRRCTQAATPATQHRTLAPHTLSTKRR